MEQSYVILKDVRKTYHMGEVSINAVDGVNFEIKKGEFVVIVGPSGAGKTTILNILGGMDTVTSGEVIVDGVHIESFKNRQLTKYRREDIGFIFQFYNLVPNLTAKENVELALQICKNPRDAETVWTWRALKQLPITAIRRRAAACFNCPCTCKKSQNAFM